MNTKIQQSIYKELTRIKKDRWCHVNIEIDKEGQLHYTANYGIIISRDEAQKQALEYWKGFFGMCDCGFCCTGKTYKKLFEGIDKRI